MGAPAVNAALAASSAQTPPLTNFGALGGEWPLGIEVTLDRTMLYTGRPADPGQRPPGFERGAENHARGHLLVRRAGRADADRASRVALCQNPINAPVMPAVEDLVYPAVDVGETVNYPVTPIYEAGNDIPTHIVL